MDESLNESSSSSVMVCPKCQGVMKRSNFRTGSVDKPKTDVTVCTKCGYRIELVESDK